MARVVITHAGLHLETSLSLATDASSLTGPPAPTAHGTFNRNVEGNITKSIILLVNKEQQDTRDHIAVRVLLCCLPSRDNESCPSVVVEFSKAE